MSHVRGKTRSERASGFDLIGAVLAGLVVGFIIGWLRSFGEELDVAELIRIIVLATSSYFLVAILSLWKDRLPRAFPCWVFIAVIGSVLTFLSINLIGSVNYIWRFRNSAAIGYASGAIQDELVDLILATLMNSLIALPLTGALHYVGSKVIARKHG